VRVCVCVCVCVHTCVSACVCMHVHVCACARVCEHAHACLGGGIIFIASEKFIVSEHYLLIISSLYMLCKKWRYILDLTFITG
jgi:hypothetical protein